MTMAEPTPIRRPLSPVDAYVARVVADAPALTQEQKVTIAALLGPQLAKAAAGAAPKVTTRRSRRRAA